jgi:agmatinase
VQEVNKFIHDIVKSSDPVHITFDVDCLDPTFALWTGTPVVGGLSTAQTMPILHSLGDLNLIGMDIVEVASVYEHAEITALAAATIGHVYLCLLAQKNVAQARSIGNKLDEKQSVNAKT